MKTCLVMVTIIELHYKSQICCIHSKLLDCFRSIFEFITLVWLFFKWNRKLYFEKYKGAPLLQNTKKTFILFSTSRIPSMKQNGMNGLNGHNHYGSPDDSPVLQHNGFHFPNGSHKKSDNNISQQYKQWVWRQESTRTKMRNGSREEFSEDGKIFEIDSLI